MPLSFILTGVVALAAGVLIVLARPELLATYHYNQVVIAVTHVFTLGWIASVIMGAMYQLVPVALETKLHSHRLAQIHFTLHTIGWTGMVAAFWTWKIPFVVVFGAIVASGASLFVYNIGCTLRRAPARTPVAFGVASSLVWISAAMLAGLFVAVGKISPLTRLDALAQMHAHAHLGGLGFFLMMLVSVSYKLIPMFTLADLQSPRRAWSSLVLLNVGLVGTFVTILLGSWWKLVFASVVIIGLALYGIEVAAILRMRKRRRLDIALIQFLTAVALLAPLCACAIVLSWPGLPMTAFTAQLENVYGLLAILGVITLAVLGMIYKIVPFLVWYSTYSKHIGRSKVPSLAELASPRLQIAGFALFMIGLCGMTTATLLANHAAVRWSAAAIAASLGCFITNIAKILSHFVRPKLEPLSPRKTDVGLLITPTLPRTVKP